MNQQTRQMVSGFLSWRKNKGLHGIGSIIPGTVSKKEYEQHASKGNEPAVYVGTYRKYNNGSLYGQWVDITSFDSYDEFYDYLRRLHGDEADPELMFQDYENFPESMYSESGMSEETFNKIIEFAESENGAALEAFYDYYGKDADDFEDRYEGEFDSEKDFAYMIVDELGWENIANKEFYFDYDMFARDLFLTDYVFLDGFVFRAY